MKRFKNSVVSYLIFIRWLFRDSLWRRKGLAFAVLTAGVMGVGFQAIVFGLLFVYAKNISDGTMLEIGGYSFDPRTSIEILLIGTVAIIALLLIASWLIYLAQLTAIRMSRQYQEYCAMRVFYLLPKAGHSFLKIDSISSAEAFIFRLVRSDSRMAGRVLRILLALIVPVVTLGVAIPVLLYLETVLTAFVVVVGGIFVFFQYRVSRKGAEYSLQFENLASAASDDYRALICHYGNVHHLNSNDLISKDIFPNGPITKQLDAYEERLFAVENSRLVSGIFMSAIIGLVLLVMGWSIISDVSGWERLLVYLVALRFAAAALQNVFSSITAINRFYPQVRRYFLFVSSCEEDVVKQHPPLDAYTLKQDVVGGATFQGSLSELELRKGHRLAVVAPFHLNGFTLPVICQSLLGADSVQLKSIFYDCRFVNTTQSCPDCSLRQALDINKESTWRDLKVLFPDETFYQLARNNLPSDLDRPITHKHWARIETRLKFIICLISALQGKYSLVILDAKGLDLLEPQHAEFYLRLFNNVIVLTLYNDGLKNFGSYGEDFVAIIDNKHLHGIGSHEWFLGIHDHAIEWLLKSKNNKSKAGKHHIDDGDMSE